MQIKRWTWEPTEDVENVAEQVALLDPANIRLPHWLLAWVAASDENVKRQRKLELHETSRGEI